MGGGSPTGSRSIRYGNRDSGRMRNDLCAGGFEVPSESTAISLDGPKGAETLASVQCTMDAFNLFQSEALFVEISNELRPAIAMAAAVPFRAPAPPPVLPGLAGLLGGLQGLFPQSGGPPEGEGGSSGEEDEWSEEKHARAKADRPKKKGNSDKNPIPAGGLLGWFAPARNAKWCL
ncbi:unnamed protein product [Polarella glacialis]|uniref:Uncharacterized protein n=1 Tax=Polarella glacialis TaxID=89957 RepID=A0A813KMD6_POLGL|nr:unnamed protein product [Polarella glacialis]CAE8707961.1 unnamed protein product [Polarella glacialis]